LPGSGLRLLGQGSPLPKDPPSGWAPCIGIARRVTICGRTGKVIGIIEGCSLPWLRRGLGGAADRRIGVVARARKLSNDRLGRRPVPPLSFFGSGSVVASLAGDCVDRMVPEPSRRFSLPGRRRTEIGRGVEARLIVRQMRLWSIETDHGRGTVRLIAARRWGSHLLAGFHRGVLQQRRERSSRGRLVFGQSLGSREEKQQRCTGHQVEPSESPKRLPSIEPARHYSYADLRPPQ
jgi:hypothetical protein